MTVYGVVCVARYLIGYLALTL